MSTETPNPEPRRTPVSVFAIKYPRSRLNFSQSSANAGFIKSSKLAAINTYRNFLLIRMVFLLFLIRHMFCAHKPVV
jgi:hypothetical protein